MTNVMTVTGPVSSDRLGMTLPHEHIFTDMSLEHAGRRGLLNDPELAYRELMLFKEAGGGTVVDQTTGGLRGRARDRELLPVNHAVAVRDVARRTGLNIVLGAGWYREPYYEERLHRTGTNDIADELIRDIEVGIDGTDVRAGLLGEIGAHTTWISPVEERVFRAVARAHKRTGVTIATHTMGLTVGLDQLDLLEEEGVDPRRVIIGHCMYTTHKYHVEIARRGAFVEFDLMGTRHDYEHHTYLEMVMKMIGAGLIGHLLLSHDVALREDYVGYGGNGYVHISTELRAELAGLGVTDEQFEQITVHNPRRALTGED